MVFYLRRQFHRFCCQRTLFLLFGCLMNSRQCSMSPVLRYLFRLSVHTWVHHSLECFVMCFFLALEYHALLKMFASCWTISSRFSLDVMFEGSRARVLSVMALIKFFSSSLSLLMCHDLAKQLSHYLYFFSFSFLLSWTYYTEGSVGKCHVTSVT